MRAKDWTSFRGCITTRSELVQAMNRWRAQIKDLEAAMGKDMKAFKCCNGGSASAKGVGAERGEHCGVQGGAHAQGSDAFRRVRSLYLAWLVHGSSFNCCIR